MPTTRPPDSDTDDYASVSDDDAVLRHGDSDGDAPAAAASTTHSEADDEAAAAAAAERERTYGMTSGLGKRDLENFMEEVFAQCTLLNCVVCALAKSKIKFRKREDRRRVDLAIPGHRELLAPLLKLPLPDGATPSDWAAYDVEPVLAAGGERNVCIKCRKSLSKGEVPKLCHKTVPVMPTPPELANLSRTEVSLVALRLVMQTMFLLRCTTGPQGAQQATAGWACSFATNNAATMAVALNLPRDIREVIVEVEYFLQSNRREGTAGAQPATAAAPHDNAVAPHAAASMAATSPAAAPAQAAPAAAPPPRDSVTVGEYRTFTKLDMVQAARIRIALRWLLEHNRLYRGVSISEERMGAVQACETAARDAGGVFPVDAVPVRDVLMENGRDNEDSAIPDAAALFGPSSLTGVRAGI